MNEEVKALKSEVALLKLQFSKRIEAVESRLSSLLVQTQQTAELNEQPVVLEQESTAFVEPHKATEVAYAQAQSIPEDAYLASTSSDFAASNTARAPAFFMLFFQGLLASLFDWFAPVAKIYQSYKERGMLGIFILTLVGIGLTLAGFGYLMQLLIDQLGAGSKALLMCLAAVFVMVLGIVLKIKTRFGEFATAIVTLGILLSYSTVYFAGSVYSLLPNVAVLALYLAIAMVCHWLALWLDTKIVAALGVIGIATMPILSNTIVIEPLYYLLSLAFVVGSSLILAYRYIGQWLAQLSLAFTLVSLEWVLGFEAIIVSVWVINLFYLLFLAYATAEILKEQAPIKHTLVFIAALVGAIVLMCFQSADIFTQPMSVSFALNALVAVVTSVFFYRIKRELSHCFILLAATWGILTIISAVSNAYWGIAWAIEGILLLAIGRKYKLSSVINQGQILTAIALVYSWSALAPYFPLPALKSVDGWVLSLTIVAIIAIWLRLINNTKVFNDYTQNRVKPLLQLIEAVWISVLVIASANLGLGNWTGALVILVQIALLFRAKNCKQVSIEVFAAILILVPLFYAYQGALSANSYRFMLLPLFAKFALISAFAQLWLWSVFYRKYQPDSAIMHVAESARILFYLLIPVCWVGSVIRRFDEAALLLLWLSPLLALLLARTIQHHLLVKEAKVLTGLASLIFIIAIGQLSLLYSLLAFVGFFSVYAIAYYFACKDATSLYRYVCSWGLFSLGFALPNIVGFHTSSLLYGGVIAAVYWALAFNALTLSAHLKRNETTIMVINLLLVVGAWFMTLSSAEYAIIPVIFLMAALYQKQQRFKQSKLGGMLKLNGDLLLHSVGAITYITLCYGFSNYRLELLIAPALAVHGALILFLKDRRITTVKYSFGLILLGIVKLSLVDAVNAVLWQKVILFMGIGVFILIASFWYQKLVNSAVVKNS
ncbi:hypothetical protein NBRC116592_10890 [Colwellia sp. KU-HH00111]|uniref:DUF2339 domain-containing protein n=1 Tax=Colwellia sp. KU-HH00111 TaxID=3127652 RepID=UPI003105503B